MDEIVIVIPSLDPDEKLINLLRDIRSKQKAVFPIVIVNDGSSHQYDALFAKALSEYDCIVLHHKENLGKGSALKTAMSYVLNTFLEAAGIVTIDSDGQHTFEDMMNCIECFRKNKHALVLGKRDFSRAIPFRSKFGNIVTRNLLGLLTGIRIEDTQTGLRVIPRYFMERLVLIEGERFEFEMKMILDAKKASIPMIEVPISTIYIEDNHSSHFRAVHDSVAIYIVFLKYVLSSGSSFLIDITVFTMILHFLNEESFETIAIASFIARAVSSFFNYLVNKLIVFGKKAAYSLLKYYSLVLFQILLSSFFVTLLSQLSAQSPVAAIKIIVDGMLFFASFHIQRKYIFK